VALVRDTDRDAVAALRPEIASWRTFGSSSRADYRYEDGAVHTGGGRVELEGTRFANAILGEAVAACVGVVDACGESGQCVERAVRQFDPLPHRMQEVGEVGGVVFINDSKATSLSALAAGLTMCERPVRLIAGGQLKETDLNLPKEMLEQKVVSAYLIGDAATEMLAAWSEVTRCRDCGTLEQALDTVRSEVQAGEWVLLSPGCASFDQFRNFEDRGNQFAENVRDHINNQAAGRKP
jgi:UDP-N-acetylmuramoylalanine--D-glutamate ligase